MDYIIEERTEYGISLRLVRIEISEGCYENLITNLPGLDFDIDDFKDLYHLRWDGETSFRDLKYPCASKRSILKNVEGLAAHCYQLSGSLTFPPLFP